MTPDEFVSAFMATEEMTFIRKLMKEKQRHEATECAGGESYIPDAKPKHPKKDKKKRK